MAFEDKDMSNNLLIVGAGIYAEVVSEIAADMGCFEKISFVDDNAKETPNGTAVIGTTEAIPFLESEYSNIIVAIGNPTVRLSLLKKIKYETTYNIVSTISPRAYVSPTTWIGQGCIIEPMAVVHTNCVIGDGCIISAGAVVNHASRCGDGAHVDCNATVDGYCDVPSGLKIRSGAVFRKEDSTMKDDEKQDISKRYPKEINGLEYTFESGI